MIYILNNKGKGKIGQGERQVAPGDLVMVEDSRPKMVRLKNELLLAENWALNAGTGLYEYVFKSERIKADTEVEFQPNTESMQLVIDAGIQTTTPVSVGQALIIAETQPTGDILVNVTIEKVQDVI